MNREAMYEALFQNWKGLPGVVTTSRILKHWTDVQPAQQHRRCSSRRRRKHPSASAASRKVGVPAEAVRVRPHRRRQVPGTVLNPILDGITNLVNRKHPSRG